MATQVNGPWQRSVLLNAATYFDASGAAPALAIIGRTAVDATTATTTMSLCDLNGTPGSNIFIQTPTATPRPSEVLSQRWAPLELTATPVFVYAAGAATEPNGAVTGVAVTTDGFNTIESTIVFAPSGVGALRVPRASFMTKCGLVTVYIADAGGGADAVFVSLTVAVQSAASVFDAAGVDVYASAPFPGDASTATISLNLPSDALPFVTWDGRVFAALADGGDGVLTVVQVPQKVGGAPTSFTTITANLGAMGVPKLVSLFHDYSVVIAADDGADLRLYAAVYVATPTPTYQLATGSGTATVVKADFAAGALFAWASYEGTDELPAIAWLSVDNANSVILTLSAAAFSVLPYVTGRSDVTCTTFVNSGSFLVSPRLFLGFGAATNSSAAIYRVQPDAGWGPKAFDVFGSPATTLTNLFGAVIVDGSSALAIGGMADGTLITAPISTP